MRVGRPHGLDGSFHVDAPLAEGDTVTVAGRDFTVVERKGSDDRPIVRLEGVSDRDAAKTLRGQTVTPSNEQRATSNENEWPIDDLIGCRIEGISCDVLEAGGELIPLVTDAVTSVDVENRVIEVDREFLGL